MDITQFLSPKQILEIKKEIAEDALSKSNPVIAMEYDNGIVVVAKNPTASLFKISEIYDRIVFAGTGVYNDYQKLRRAGVQYADVRGFAYSRNDVRARSLANEFSAILGEIFSREQIPLEVEIMVCEISANSNDNRLYRIPYTGALLEEKRFTIIGDIKEDERGEPKRNLIRNFLRQRLQEAHPSLSQAVLFCQEAFREYDGSDQTDDLSWLEVMTLDRQQPAERKCRRLSTDDIRQIIGENDDSGDP